MNDLEMERLRLEELRIKNQREEWKEMREQQALYLKLMASIVGIGMVIISATMLLARFYPA